MAALITFMPFESEEGWAIRTDEMCRSLYFGEPTTTSMQNTRKVLARLERTGHLVREYAEGRKGKTAVATYYVDWDVLLEPVREAVAEGRAKLVTVTRETSHCDAPSSYSSLSTRQDPSSEGRHLTVVTR